MHLHPVVDQVARAHPIDAALLVLYVTLFAGAVLAGLYRPFYGVAALVAAQPFAIYADVFHTTITVSKVLIIGLAVGLFGRPGAFAFLWEREARRFLVAGLLVLAATALTVLVALHRGPVLRETAKALEYVAIFAVAYCAYRIDPNPRLLRLVVICTVLAVSLAALAQEVLGAPSGLYLHNHAVPRIAGPLEGPNQLAGYLDVAIPIVLAFAIVRSGTLVVVVLIFSLAADMLTFSRAGYVGAATAIVAVLLIYRRFTIVPLLAAGIGIAIGAVVIGAWETAARLAPAIGGYANSGATVFRIEGLTKSSYAGGVGSRADLWHAAFYLWRSHPIWGIGAGNYELELPQAGYTGIRTHSNSLYVQAMVEGGIPLFVATLWLLFTSIASFVRNTARSPFIAGALAGSLGLAIHQIGDLLTFYPKVGGWWWLVLALAAAHIHQSAETQPAI